MTLEELESIRQDLIVQCNKAIADHLQHRKNVLWIGWTRDSWDEYLLNSVDATVAMAALYHALQAMSTDEEWEDYLDSNPQTKELCFETKS